MGVGRSFATAVADEVGYGIDRDARAARNRRQKAVENSAQASSSLLG
jgi:hypothetical protein